MSALDGWKTFVFALIQFGAGVYFVATGNDAAGWTLIGFSGGSIGLRQVTSGPAAWRTLPAPSTTTASTIQVPTIWRMPPPSAEATNTVPLTPAPPSSGGSSTTVAPESTWTVTNGDTS